MGNISTGIIVNDRPYNIRIRVVTVTLLTGEEVTRLFDDFDKLNIYLDEAHTNLKPGQRIDVFVCKSKIKSIWYNWIKNDPLKF